MDKTRLGVFIVIFGIGALLGLSVGMFWALKLFDFAGTDASAQVIAASIAAVGAFFTAMVTGAGMLLRKSTEDSRLRMEKQAHELKAIEMDATNKRLDMEASMKAVELFKSATGSTTPAERAGVLFALSGLGKHAFSMTLLDNLLEEAKVTASSAIYLIDEALVKGDSRAQILAASVLKKYTSLFVLGGEVWDWPDHITLRWMPELDGDAKHVILAAFLQAAIRTPFSGQQAATVAGWLARLLEAESDEDLKHSAAYALSIILKGYPESITVPDGRGGDLCRAQMHALVEESPDSTFLYVREIAPRLEAWIEGESVAEEESAPQEPPSDEAPEEN